MSKKAKIVLIIVGALIILFAVGSHGSFHVTKEMMSSHSAAASCNSQPTGDTLRLFRNVAIVVPECGSADVRLGNLIAEKLQKKLDRSHYGRQYRRSDPKTAYPACDARARIYKHADAAKRSGADFYYTIEVKDYRYSFWPFAKDWNAKVIIYASTKGVHEGRPVVTGGRSRYGTIDTSLEYDYFGRVVGLFSSSYLTQKIAEEISAESIDDVTKQGYELADEFFGKDKPD